MNCTSRPAPADATELATCIPADESNIVELPLKDLPMQILERKCREMDDTAAERLRIARMRLRSSFPKPNGKKHDSDSNYRLANKDL